MFFRHLWHKGLPDTIYRFPRKADSRPAPSPTGTIRADFSGAAAAAPLRVTVKHFFSCDKKSISNIAVGTKRGKMSHFLYCNYVNRHAQSRSFPLWKTPVEKLVEIVEKCEFSTVKPELSQLVASKNSCHLSTGAGKTCPFRKIMSPPLQLRNPTNSGGKVYILSKLPRCHR